MLGAGVALINLLMAGMFALLAWVRHVPGNWPAGVLVEAITVMLGDAVLAGIGAWGSILMYRGQERGRLTASYAIVGLILLNLLALIRGDGALVPDLVMLFALFGAHFIVGITHVDARSQIKTGR